MNGVIDPLNLTTDVLPEIGSISEALPPNHVQVTEYIPCPQCGAQCKGIKGLQMHTLRSHGTLKGKDPRKLKKEREARAARSETAVRSALDHLNKETHGPANKHPHNPGLDAHAYFITGYVACFIEQYCRGHEIPTGDVTRRVGEALLGTTRG